MDERERPTPPAELEPTLRAFLEALVEEDAETIRTVADHVDDLAAWKAALEERESVAPTGDGGGGSSPEPTSDDSVPIPDGVPERASVSRAEIGGVEYRYYQWREGDRVRSTIETR